MWRTGHAQLKQISQQLPPHSNTLIKVRDQSIFMFLYDFLYAFYPMIAKLLYEFFSLMVTPSL